MASALVPPCVCGMVMLVVTHISKHISSSLNVGQLSPMFLRSHTAPPRAPPPLYTTQRNTSRSTRARCENGRAGCTDGMLPRPGTARSEVERGRGGDRAQVVVKTALEEIDEQSRT